MNPANREQAIEYLSAITAAAMEKAATGIADLAAIAEVMAAFHGDRHTDVSSLILDRIFRLSTELREALREAEFHKGGIHVS